VLGLYRRPFESVAALDEALIARWNARVAPTDEVWHLGDFALGKPAPAMAAILERLHGAKHLVAGNNDPPAARALAGWASVQPYAELTVDGLALVLCHYPFRSWNGMAKGAVDLHGHSHGRMKPLPRQLDVGVDAWDFVPIGIAEIRAAVVRRAPR